MLSIAITLFLAGLLTILLPCILPLIPIVLGVSVAGRSNWRPLLTILGMLVSFVGFTFVLLTVLRHFVELADILRIATYDVLLLFGFGFLTHRRGVQVAGALLGGLFFWDKGPVAVGIAAILGIIAMLIGGRIAARIQQAGADIQQKTREELGGNSPLTAFVIGLTLGLVWVPCAGPALGFALSLVREEPGVRAALLLLSYGLGTSVPLLLIGYGGQAAVHRVRAIAPYTGRIKQAAGVLLIVTAVSLQFHLFEKLQIWLLDHTRFGDLGTRLEETFFGDRFQSGMFQNASTSSSGMYMNLPSLPKLSRAPELAGLTSWQNSEPLTLAGLKGKVVLIDFWTYSCINCIRTLPYIRGYWEKYKDTGKFVIIGVHTPEFVFEKDEQNVADALQRHGLTYPVAMDNDYATWKAFANHYWPAKYLIDADGYIRYTHFGEGAYEETDEAIASLLSEIGVEGEGTAGMGGMGSTEGTGGGGRERSPETYLGERSWPALGNARGEPTEDVVTYTAPSSMQSNHYYLVGDWQLVDGERQVLRSSSGEIRMRWTGSDINLVLGPAEAAGPVVGTVMIDGKKVKDITIDRYDLYNLFAGGYGEHELVLRLQGAGVAGYAFTFGS